MSYMMPTEGRLGPCYLPQLFPPGACEHVRRKRSLSGLGQADASAADLVAWRRDLGLANEAQIPVTALRSIRSVESGANPAAIRFEPHLYWRMRKGLPTGATGAQIRAAMTAADMAAVPYTPGNTSWRAANGLSPCRIDRSASCTGSETNRAAFERAFRLAPTEAVKATSWGSYQVLGSHLLRLYGDSPSAAVRAFDADPRTVGERLLASWMRANPRAQAAARAFDWGELAHRYNGCSDCSTYVSRLRDAYSRWSAEWESVRAAVEAAGALAVSTAAHNPMTTILLGVTVVGAGSAFAWWAYKRSMRRNRRR
jgi:hypothetical protein